MRGGISPEQQASLAPRGRRDGRSGARPEPRQPVRISLFRDAGSIHEPLSTPSSEEERGRERKRESAAVVLARREIGGLGVPRSRDTVTSVLTLVIPQEVLGVLGADSARATGEIRMLAAMKLFELGRLSSGAAATLAGVGRAEFHAKLGEYGVSPFQVSPEDLEQDLENARRASRRS